MRIQSVSSYVFEIEYRMSFDYGSFSEDETEDEADGSTDVEPKILLEVDTEIDGESASGISMGSIGASWFIKGSKVPLEEGRTAMLDVFGRSYEFAAGLEGETPFDIWIQLYQKQRNWAESTDYPPLLWMYGVSLIEQGIIDAFCRHHDMPFVEALHTNALGLKLGEIHPELAGESPTTWLPDEPLQSAAIRHTVGQTDPLDQSDVDQPLNDGLPQSLSEYVTELGIDHFKIKLSSDLDADAERLERIAQVLDRCGLTEYHFTLDANEGYPTVAAFKEQWNQLTERPALEEFFDRLLYVEQPLPRNESFRDETRQTLRDWGERPPIIIDESDDSIDSLRRALTCGYDGTSHKNGKGVFKGIANRCFIAYRRGKDPDGTYLMSGEDLTTVEPIEILQDFAVMAAIGMDHIERNAYHYHRGMDSLSEDVQAAVLAAHPDLYRRHDDDFVTIDITEGSVHLNSVTKAPFGRGFDLDVTEYTPLDRWVDHG